MKAWEIEICCGSADDVVEAEAGGADRVELNSSLFQGGLTPSVGTLITVKKHSAIPVMCMVRPREGGFCYTDLEWESAMADAARLLEHGADGLVFGFLRADGTVDAERCRRMLDILDGQASVFHRAIDVTPDWRAALDTLIALGFTRVLTSGQQPGALQGAELIARMIRHAAGRIQILPGAGIKPDNAAELAAKTGCTMMHMSMHRLCRDDSAVLHNDIHFGAALYPPENLYKKIDRDKLAAFSRAVRG